MNRIISHGDIVSHQQNSYMVQSIMGITAKLSNSSTAESIYVRVSHLQFEKLTQLSSLEKLEAIFKKDLNLSIKYLPKIGDLVSTRSSMLEDLFTITAISVDSLYTLKNINQDKFVKMHIDEMCNSTNTIPIPLEVVYKSV